MRPIEVGQPPYGSACGPQLRDIPWTTLNSRVSGGRAPPAADPAGSFYYVRPLATIEPTAVKLGMPVRTKYGYNDIPSLQAALIHPTKANTTIFVAWEHVQLQKVVQNIMNRYGGGAAVPSWISGDYDSLYVVRVDYIGSTISAQFERDREGLNGQPTACPD